MRIPLRNYLPLFKFRICSFITFSAVVGLISASSPSASISISGFFFLILTTMMASAGASAFNNYFDTDIDAVMKRTGARPLVSGRVADSKMILLLALVLFAASILLSFRVLNYMVGLHLFLGGFVYAVVYTVWLKRRSSLNIIIGGLAGSFAVLAGGSSAAPGLCLLPVLLAVTMFFWTPSHFWSFAVFHREEYEKAGIPMLPNVVGDSRAAWYILLNTGVLVFSSFLPSYFGTLGLVYAVSALLLGGFFIFRNLQLLFNPSKENAWKNFTASMIYLGGLFLAVIIDVKIKSI
ncbi:MAG: protoheme IX farnesyltransferase [Deltaproteobacteria bacterium]|nr:protoheme IX farnesyltransferase [Deltaproteobacteria bacterium]